MPIGTTVTAARAGEVIRIEESYFDGQIAASGSDNFAVLRHADGTTALYGALAPVHPVLRSRESWYR